MSPVFFVFGMIGALGALGIVAGIVATLTQHQQKMAQIMRSGAPQQANEETSQLRQEVAELKQLVHQQMIALDSFAGLQKRLEEDPIQKRLEHI